MTTLTSMTPPPTPTPYIPTRSEFAHINRYGEYGEYDPEKKRAIFQTPYRAAIFDQVYPDLREAGWEIGYMSPGRSVTMTVSWDMQDQVDSGQVTIEDTDGKRRTYKRLTTASCNRLRRIWQKCPMSSRDVTPLGKRGAVYAFRW